MRDAEAGTVLRLRINENKLYMVRASRAEYLGLDTFKNIINHSVLKPLPMILETPTDLAGYKEEIALLKSSSAQTSRWGCRCTARPAPTR